MGHADARRPRAREPGAKKRGRVKHTTFLKCFFKNTSIPDGLTDSEHYPMPMQAIGIPRHVSPTAELWDYGAADLLSFGPKPRGSGDCEAMKGRRTAELWDHGPADLLGFWPKPRVWRTARL